MPGRTLSSDSMTLHSMMQSEHMDPEWRLQIQSNIKVLYDPSTAAAMNIATCRGSDGQFMALIVKQDHLAKALTNPQSLSGEPKPTRSAAMLSLLEATEQRIGETLIKTNNCRTNGTGNKKKHNSKNGSDIGVTRNGSAPASPEPRIIPMPNGDRTPVDAASVTSTEKPASFSEKAKESAWRALYWKKHIRFDPPAERNVVD